MTIATEIQRLQGIKAGIMAALERKNVDTTGKNISDVGDLIRSIEVEPSNIVHIGEHDYPYVKIGNLLWTTQNLYENFGSKRTSSKPLYNTPLEKCGYLYKRDSIVAYHESKMTSALSNLLPEGWRLPFVQDFNDLKTSVPNVIDLISVDDGGTNASGFNAFIADVFYSTTVAYETRFHGCNYYSNAYLGCRLSLNSMVIGPGAYYSDVDEWYYVRLCKDA